MMKNDRCEAAWVGTSAGAREDAPRLSPTQNLVRPRPAMLQRTGWLSAVCGLAHAATWRRLMIRI